MLFLPISILLVALAVALSWLNKAERPVRGNLLPIILLVGQALFLLWLVNLQRNIGCATTFGDCYVQHEDQGLLEFSKLVFALSSWGYWLYLGILIILRLVRKGDLALKGVHNAQQ